MFLETLNNCDFTKDN